MRCVITGGAGFLGSWVCELLLSEGYEVVCLDNLTTGSKKNVEGFSKDGNFSYVNHNVTKHIDIDGRVDFVLHFASPASPVDYQKNPIGTLKVGSLGTHNTLGLALAKEAVFVLASTSEIYGDPLVNPQPESYWGNVNPVGPRACYDESKRFAEAMTMSYQKTHGVDTKIARIFNTYGPRMRKDDGRVIPNFINQALSGEPLTAYGDGRQTRSFCYISDLVEGIHKLMTSRTNDPINLGNPEECTIMELAELVKELTRTKREVQFRPLPQDDPHVRCPDISKARRELKWEPKVGLRKGLEKTIEWFRHD